MNNKEVVNFGGITVNSPKMTTEIVKARGFGQIPQYRVELVRGKDGPTVDLSSPISVGDAISYIIRVPYLSTDARIGRCWARDAASSLELSDDDGCSLQLKGNVWNNFERSEQSGELIFRNSIKAWAFPTRFLVFTALRKR